MSVKLLRTTLFFLVLTLGALAGRTYAQTVVFPSGSVTVLGTSTTGASFTFSGTLTQNDTITFTQTGNPCLQISGTAYCSNGAGVLTVAGAVAPVTPVGGASTFSGPTGSIPAGTWTYGALLMSVSGVGTVQVFPANAANGLGSSTPPPSLTLPLTTLSALGFGAFSQTNPTITFIVADTGFADNGGQFVLTQAAVPTLGEWATLLLAVLLVATAVYQIRRRRLVTA